MSDNEIRSKLRNRSRSPLQATDLYMNSNKFAEAKTMGSTAASKALREPISYDVFKDSTHDLKQQ